MVAQPPPRGNRSAGEGRAGGLGAGAGLLPEPVGPLLAQLPRRLHRGPSASRTVEATPDGSSAKAFSRSAETGRSVAATIEAACASASRRVTVPSSRPSVAAWPLLVVASAWKPSQASSLADPASHGFGSSSGRWSWCRARNRLALAAWSVTGGRPLPGGVVPRPRGPGGVGGGGRPPPGRWGA